MKSSFLPVLSVFLTAYAIVVVDTTSTRAYPSGPDPGVTGGFGEMTCNQSGCHNTFELNAGKALGLGDLLVSGLPKQYEPGKTYPVKVEITHTKDRQDWGFQLAARVKATGMQAGQLEPIDGSTQVLDEKGIQYIEHTLAGTAANTFNFNWVAPTSPVGEVIMHAAGNAADGGLSPTDDYIYTTSVTVSP
jgi:hypothetical protein